MDFILSTKRDISLSTSKEVEMMIFLKLFPWKLIFNTFNSNLVEERGNGTEMVKAVTLQFCSIQ